MLIAHRKSKKQIIRNQRWKVLLELNTPAIRREILTYKKKISLKTTKKSNCLGPFSIVTFRIIQSLELNYIIVQRNLLLLSLIIKKVKFSLRWFGSVVRVMAHGLKGSQV